MFLLGIGCFFALMRVDGKTSDKIQENVDGIVWTFEIDNGCAKLCNQCIPWRTSGNIVIPDELGGCPVVEIGSSAFAGHIYLTSIFIPGGVRIIGYNAFVNCNQLKKFILSEENAFFTVLDGILYSKDISELISCPGAMSDVKIPDSVTYIRPAAFGGCCELKYIYIPESVTGIGSGAFGGCSKLVAIDVAKGNESFIVVNEMLCDSSALHIIAAPGALSSFKIPPSVISIDDDAFCGCVNLQELKIPSNIRAVGSNAFNQCDTLSSITVYEGLTSIEYGAFSSCPMLKEITLPTTLKAMGSSVFYNGSLCVYYCSKGEPICEDCVYDSDDAIVSYGQWSCADGIWQGKPFRQWSPPSLGTGIYYESVAETNIVQSVVFDANEGVCSASTTFVRNRAAVGELPTATRSNYDFLGWFTAAVGGEQVSSETVVTADVTWYAQWKAQEADVPTYGPWGESEDVANPDKLGPTYLQDMTLTISGAAGAQGDVVAVYRTDTDAVCGLGKVLDDSGTLTVVCYAPTGTKLHFKVWIAASGVTEPTILDCDATCDLAAPTSGSFYTGHALVVSDDKELTLSLKNADWHTVSFNVVPDDPSPAAVFADVADKVAAVTQGVNYWMPGKAGTLKAIEVGKGYWVKTTDDDVSWTVSGKTNPSVEIPLTAGWNLIGYAPEDEEAVASVLKTALAEKAIDYVTYGVSFYPNGTLTKMTPGKAYWVHAKKAYTLVYDKVSAAKLMMAFAAPKLASAAATPTYGPFGESEDVANPDKLGPTMFTDVSLTIDGEPAAVGDCVAAYRGDTGALCGLGKVLETPGALTIVCYAPEGVALNFKAWTAASGMDDPTIVACGKTTAPTAGEIVEETLTLTASMETPTYTVIVGAKASVDVSLKGQGYSTKTLPKGLSYSDKTGLVTGTCKAATAAEGVEVTFTKKNAENIVLIFIARAEDKPTIECEGLDGTTLALGVTGGSAGIPLDLGAESGIKSVTATKLPTGMKIASSKDKTSWYITGAPTKAGTYEVAITLTTAAGNKVTKNFTVTVAALPTGATGTFNGFVQKAGASEGETFNAGSLQVTVSGVGRIVAKVITASGTSSFTATGWDSVNEGVYSVKMATKKGDVLTLACDSGAAWNAKQMTGTFAAASDGLGQTALPVEAQKNAFGKQWFFNATGDDANGWALSFAENAKAAALTVTLNADGKTSVAGKLGAYKITASGYADVSGIGTGAIFADFAPVISVKSGSTTTKKVLSLRTNLWFDKKDDHEEGVGSAVFVP